MVINEKGMEFEGISEDSAIIKIFLDKLKADNAFKTIDLGSIRREEDGFRTPFKLYNFFTKIIRRNGQKNLLIKKITSKKAKDYTYAIIFFLSFFFIFFLSSDPI